MRLPGSSALEAIPLDVVEAAHDGLINAFRAHYPISDQIEQRIREHSTLVLYKPREVILNYGEICNYFGSRQRTGN